MIIILPDVLIKGDLSIEHCHEEEPDQSCTEVVGLSVDVWYAHQTCQDHSNTNTKPIEQVHSGAGHGILLRGK